MDWKFVDTQEDLEELDSSNCWDDSDVVEYIGLHGDEEYFPRDVSRSGHFHKNLHILIQASSGRGSHIEVVLIACEHFSSSYLSMIHFDGRVGGLKGIEIYDFQNTLRMKCARLIYRWLDEEPKYNRSYFLSSFRGL